MTDCVILNFSQTNLSVTYLFLKRPLSNISKDLKDKQSGYDREGGGQTEDFAGVEKEN